MDKRRMCPNCRAFITKSDRVCPYCNEPVGPRAVDVRDPGAVLGGLIPAAKFTTSVLLLLNIAFFIAQEFGGRMGNLLTLLGDKNRQAILQGHEWWRLITAGFLHGGYLHIGMNMWVLNDLGAEVERTFGTARFLVIYFLSTMGGYLLSTYWIAAPSLGASAGLLGLIGAMIAFGVRNRTEVGRQIRAFYIKWAVYGIVLGLLPGFNIDNAAHLGGLATGFCVAYVAGTPVHSSRGAESIWRWLAGIACAITAYAFFILIRELLAAPHLLPPQLFQQ